MINPRAQGLIKEQLVIEYLIKKSWKILYHNKKILNVEIDILAQKQGEGLLVEVKSIKGESYLNKILKSKQKERLKKVATSLCEDFPKGLSLLLATVDFNNKISFFKIV